MPGAAAKTPKILIRDADSGEEIGAKSVADALLKVNALLSKNKMGKQATTYAVRMAIQRGDVLNGRIKIHRKGKAAKETKVTNNVVPKGKRKLRIKKRKAAEDTADAAATEKRAKPAAEKKADATPAELRAKRAPPSGSRGPAPGLPTQPAAKLPDKLLSDEQVKEMDEQRKYTPNAPAATAYEPRRAEDLLDNPLKYAVDSDRLRKPDRVINGEPVPPFQNLKERAREMNEIAKSNVGVVTRDDLIKLPPGQVRDFDRLKFMDRLEDKQKAYDASMKRLPPADGINVHTVTPYLQVFIVAKNVQYSIQVQEQPIVYVNVYYASPFKDWEMTLMRGSTQDYNAVSIYAKSENGQDARQTASYLENYLQVLRERTEREAAEAQKRAEDDLARARKSAEEKRKAEEEAERLKEKLRAEKEEENREKLAYLDALEAEQRRLTEEEQLRRAALQQVILEQQQRNKEEAERQREEQDVPSNLEQETGAPDLGEPTGERSPMDVEGGPSKEVQEFLKEIAEHQVNEEEEEKYMQQFASIRASEEMIRTTEPAQMLKDAISIVRKLRDMLMRLTIKVAKYTQGDKTNKETTFNVFKFLMQTRADIRIALAIHERRLAAQSLYNRGGSSISPELIEEYNNEVRQYYDQAELFDKYIGEPQQYEQILPLIQVDPAGEEDVLRAEQQQDQEVPLGTEYGDYEPPELSVPPAGMEEDVPPASLPVAQEPAAPQEPAAQEQRDKRSFDEVDPPEERQGGPKVPRREEEEGDTMEEDEQGEQGEQDEQDGLGLLDSAYREGDEVGKPYTTTSDDLDLEMRSLTYSRPRHLRADVMYEDTVPQFSRMKGFRNFRRNVETDAANEGTAEVPLLEGERRKGGYRTGGLFSNAGRARFARPTRVQSTNLDGNPQQTQQPVYDLQVDPRGNMTYTARASPFDVKTAPSSEFFKMFERKNKFEGFFGKPPQKEEFEGFFPKEKGFDGTEEQKEEKGTEKEKEEDEESDPEQEEEDEEEDERQGGEGMMLIVPVRRPHKGKSKGGVASRRRRHAGDC